MSELKPCPFCGGKARFTPHHQSGYEVCCETCFARMHIRAALPQSVIEAWNTRATPPLEPNYDGFEEWLEANTPASQVLSATVKIWAKQAWYHSRKAMITEWMNTNKGE